MKSYSLTEIATMLSVHKRTVDEWIANGELRAINTSRKRGSQRPRRRVLDSDLEAFLASRSNCQDDPPPQRTRKRAMQEVHEFF